MGIMDYHTYKACIDACLRCAVICNHCAKSCTLEPDVTMMARCIQLDMECAAICYASAELMSLHSTKAANDPTLLAADGLHPSGKEYKRWAEKLAEQVSSILK